MSLIKKAQRSAAYLKLGMTGPSGSGKTFSAIRLAKGLMGSLEKVVILDTENGSGNLYSHLGDYSVLPFEAPFHPDRYVKAISYCIEQGFECIIIDSTSHEWDGPGGCLEIQADLGGKFQDWKPVTKMHKDFINSILQSKAHVICCMRKKTDYAINEVDGKKKIEKLGTKEIQREGFEYELTVNFDIQMNHLALTSKDRTGLFSSGIPFQITEEIGKNLKAWNEGK